MTPDVVVAAVATLARCFVDDLRREMRSVPADRRFTIAVPGGSVAEAFLPHLVTSDIDWTRVEIFWTDERAVPPTAPDSNYGRAKRTWLAPAGVPPARLHRMPVDTIPPSHAAERYAGALRAAAGAPPRLDYLLLGAGEDGHVASVFPSMPVPGSPTPSRSDAGASPVLWVEDAPKPPRTRMTLSLVTLAGARRTVIGAFGASKARMIATALDAALDPPGTADSPLASLLRVAERPLLLLDPEAARLVSASPAGE